MLLLTKSPIYLPGTRRRTLSKSLKVGPISLKFIGIAILAAAGLFYLAQSTQQATKNYQFRGLEETRDKMEAERERLELETIRLKSLNQLKEVESSLGLQPVEKINFLPANQKSPTSQQG